MIETPVIVGHEMELKADRLLCWYRRQASTPAKSTFRWNNKKINAKSIMGMMSLALQEGDEVTVVAEGEDEEKAAEGIKTF